MLRIARERDHHTTNMLLKYAWTNCRIPRHYCVLVAASFEERANQQ